MRPESRTRCARGLLLPVSAVRCPALMDIVATAIGGSYNRQGKRRRTRPGLLERELAMRRTVLFLLLAFPAASAAQSAEPVNLVANGDFSQVAGGKPENWAVSGSPIDVTQTLSVEQDADGKRFARLVCARLRASGRRQPRHAGPERPGQLGQGPPVSILVPDAGYRIAEPHDQRCDPRDRGLAP